MIIKHYNSIQWKILKSEIAKPRGREHGHGSECTPT